MALVTPPLVPCVGAVVLDPAGRLLVVRRGREPGRGLWSIPGGRVEPGEADDSAVAREVREETGLDVTVGRYVGSVQRAAPGGGTYDIRDYLARPADDGRVPRAGDDADDARWVTRAQLLALPVVDGLWDALESWGLLPD
jgi:8-oxo-dGTP diphosphatase